MEEKYFSKAARNYPPSGIRKMFDLAAQYPDAIKLTVGLRLSQEEEFDGADQSVHRISATPEREVNW